MACIRCKAPPSQRIRCSNCSTALLVNGCTAINLSPPCLATKKSVASDQMKRQTAGMCGRCSGTISRSTGNVTPKSGTPFLIFSLKSSVVFLFCSDSFNWCFPQVFAQGHAILFIQSWREVPKTDSWADGGACSEVKRGDCKLEGHWGCVLYFEQRQWWREWAIRGEGWGNSLFI